MKRIAIKITQGNAGVKWTQDELKMKETALFNSKKYSSELIRLIDRFFDTVKEYGGTELASLCKFTTNSVGEPIRYVLF